MKNNSEKVYLVTKIQFYNLIFFAIVLSILNIASTLLRVPNIVLFVIFFTSSFVSLLISLLIIKKENKIMEEIKHAKTKEDFHSIQKKYIHKKDVISKELYKRIALLLDEKEWKTEELSILKNTMEEVLQDLEYFKTMSESALKSKTAFLSNITNELKTPIHEINRILDNIRATELDDEQSEYVRVLGNTSSNLFSFLQDIIDISHIESGRIKIVQTDFRIRDLLTSIYESYEPLAKQKGINFQLKFFDDLPELLYGDSQRIRQILNHLITNAIKYTSSGSVVIRAFVSKKSGSLIAIRFEIEDSGIGLTKEEQSIIFNQFSKQESKKLKQGIGLGLAMAKQLTELLHGMIGVQSRIGEGSTFWLNITLREVQELETKDLNLETRNRKEEVILIVDDNQISQKLTQRFIEKMGYDVDLENNIEDAIIKCQKNNYSMILIDTKLNANDAFFFTRKIREEEALSGKSGWIPIIGMILGKQEDERQKCWLSGMDDILEKPIHLENIQEKLNKFFSNKE